MALKRSRVRIPLGPSQKAPSFLCLDDGVFFSSTVESQVRKVNRCGEAEAEFGGRISLPCTWYA